MELPQEPPSKPKKKSKALACRSYLSYALFTCWGFGFFLLYGHFMTEWPYWVIFILFPLPVWIPYFKNLFEWMNGKDVKAFDDVIKRARARGKALEARKKSFKKWEKDEGNNFPPHLEIFDKDRK